jgi:hypothetical protein
MTVLITVAASGLVYVKVTVAPTTAGEMEPLTIKSFPIVKAVDETAQLMAVGVDGGSSP